MWNFKWKSGGGGGRSSSILLHLIMLLLIIIPSFCNDIIGLKDVETMQEKIDEISEKALEKIDEEVVNYLAKFDEKLRSRVKRRAQTPMCIQSLCSDRFLPPNSPRQMPINPTNPLSVTVITNQGTPFVPQPQQFAQPRQEQRIMLNGQLFNPQPMIINGQSQQRAQEGQEQKDATVPENNKPETSQSIHPPRPSHLPGFPDDQSKKLFPLPAVPVPPSSHHLTPPHPETHSQSHSEHSQSEHSHPEKHPHSSSHSHPETHHPESHQQINSHPPHPQNQSPSHPYHSPHSNFFNHHQPTPSHPHPSHFNPINHHPQISPNVPFNYQPQPHESGSHHPPQTHNYSPPSSQQPHSISNQHSHSIENQNQNHGSHPPQSHSHSPPPPLPITHHQNPHQISPPHHPASTSNPPFHQQSHSNIIPPSTTSHSQSPPTAYSQTKPPESYSSPHSNSQSHPHPEHPPANNYQQPQSYSQTVPLPNPPQVPIYTHSSAPYSPPPPPSASKSPSYLPVNPPSPSYNPPPSLPEYSNQSPDYGSYQPPQDHPNNLPQVPSNPYASSTLRPITYKSIYGEEQGSSYREGVKGSQITTSGIEEKSSTNSTDLRESPQKPTDKEEKEVVVSTPLAQGPMIYFKDIQPVDTEANEREFQLKENANSGIEGSPQQRHFDNSGQNPHPWEGYNNYNENDHFLAHHHHPEMYPPPYEVHHPYPGTGCSSNSLNHDPFQPSYCHYGNTFNFYQGVPAAPPIQPNPVQQYSSNYPTIPCSENLIFSCAPTVYPAPCQSYGGVESGQYFGAEANYQVPSIPTEQFYPPPVQDYSPGPVSPPLPAQYQQYPPGINGQPAYPPSQFPSAREPIRYQAAPESVPSQPHRSNDEEALLKTVDDSKSNHEPGQPESNSVAIERQEEGEDHEIELQDDSPSQVFEFGQTPVEVEAKVKQVEPPNPPITTPESTTTSSPISPSKGSAGAREPLKLWDPFASLKKIEPNPVLEEIKNKLLRGGQIH